MPKPTCGTRALAGIRGACREISNLTGATPGERKAGATVAVIVNDSAAIAQAIAFEAYA